MIGFLLTIVFSQALAYWWVFLPDDNTFLLGENLDPTVDMKELVSLILCLIASNIALIFSFYIKGMTFEYTDMVDRHLTKKEKKVRRNGMMELAMDFDSLKGGKVPCKKKCQRWKIFCCKKLPLAATTEHI